jgi:2-dehydro-3-deoxyglucarate aldolase/4-hydroxy-2-oxoheptanedioate aldolase
MPDPAFRARLRAPGLTLGLFCMEFCTPGLPMIAARAGADFVVLDMEHSGFGFETIKAACMGGKAAGMPTLVRTAHRHPQEVSRALDVGADGLMAPLVSSAAEARDYVAWATYPPAGSRGAAMAIAHDGYARGVPAETMAAADTGRAIIIQIETAAGAADAEAIAAVDGVDCLWIGHFDLSISLGIPGRFDHPDFLAAEARVRDAARRHGKALGRLAASPEEAAALAERGYDTIAVTSDIAAIQGRIADGVARIRGGRS